MENLCLVCNQSIEENILTSFLPKKLQKELINLDKCQ